MMKKLNRQTKKQKLNKIKERFTFFYALLVYGIIGATSLFLSLLAYFFSAIDNTNIIFYTCIFLSCFLMWLIVITAAGKQSKKNG